MEQLFVVDEDMPCEPKDLRFYPYALMNTFDRGEREEAAARLVKVAQEEGRWVGVSFSRIIDKVVEEAEKLSKVSGVKERNFQTSWKHKRDVRRYRFLAILTLGVYALFVKKPMLSLEPVPEWQEPFSIVLMYGLSSLVDGFLELQERGFVRIDRSRVEEEGFKGMYVDDVVYPTASLATRILEVQKSR